MSLVGDQAAFLLDATALIHFATNQGFQVTGGELFRTTEQQEIYVKTMNSNHLRRLAIDLNFIKDGVLCYDAKLLEPIGKYWESLHPKNRWGGHFQSLKDMPHFERNV
jgi:peptidoglycan L-alanyl-D-glutamate endopeptidase CwlK